MKLAAICETAFHYQDKIRPIDYVVNVAFNMQVAQSIFIYACTVNCQYFATNHLFIFGQYLGH